MKLTTRSNTSADGEASLADARPPRALATGRRQATSLRSVVAFTLAVAIALPLTAAASLRERIGFDQNIGAPLPLDAPFTDASGRAVTLGAAFDAKPAVLVFGYFNCPQLCGVTADGVIECLRQIRPAAGVDYQVVYLSIDPLDTPAAASERRRSQTRRYGRVDSESGWHVLTGERRAIDRVTEAAGFRYQADPASGLYAHASGFVIVRPDGVISRYFLGVDFRPGEVAAALREAAANRTGTKILDLLLACAGGGRIGSAGAVWPWRLLQAGAAGTLFALAFGIGHLLRHERRRALKPPSP